MQGSAPEIDPRIDMGCAFPREWPDIIHVSLGEVCEHSGDAGRAEYPSDGVALLAAQVVDFNSEYSYHEELRIMECMGFSNAVLIRPGGSDDPTALISARLGRPQCCRPQGGTLG